MKWRKYIQAKIIDNDFARSVTVLMSGSFISQVAVVAITPILTRLYSPDQFGVYAVYTSILFTIAAITSLHYESAIPLPKKETDAVAVLLIALAILIGSVLLVTVVISLYASSLLVIFNNELLIRSLWLLPFSIIGFGLFQVFQIWLLRKEHYQRIAFGKMRMNFSQIGAQTGFGTFANSAGLLITGEAIGRLIGGIGLAFTSRKDILPQLKHIDWPLLKTTLFRYKHFPLLSSWSTIFNGISSHIPTFYIASLLGMKMAGLYLIAFRILALPDALLGYSVKQVYYSKSVKLLHVSLSDFTALFWSILKRMSLLSTMIFLVISVISPVIFPIVFGSEWKEAGMLVPCMCILFFSQLIISPISINLITLEQLHLQAIAEGLRLICTLIGLSIAYFYLSSAWAIVLCISIAGTIGCGIIGFLSWYAIKAYEKKHSPSN